VGAVLAPTGPRFTQPPNNRATQGRTEAELWELQKPLGAKVLGSQDTKEGPLAFIQKRAPNWQGE
jgi:hypothetical protein